VNVLILGHAASGKSTLIKNFGNYLREKGYSTKLVNLDPATDPIYTPDLNSRDIVKTEEVMENFGLGINGALLKSMELLQNHYDKLIIKDDFVLYDTPGQLELFIYTDFGEKFAEELRKSDFSAVVFLVDSMLSRTPENYLSSIAQSAVVSLRTGLQTVTVFNKSDVCDPPDFDHVKDSLEKKEGVLAELMMNFIPFYEHTSLRFRTLKMSAKNGYGFDELLDMLTELYCSCGDLS
jgi:hypothetical protein